MQKSTCDSPNTSRSPVTKLSSSPVFQYKKQIREKDGELRKLKASLTEKQHVIDLLKSEVEEFQKKISDLLDEIKKFRKLESEKRNLQAEVQKLISTVEQLQLSVEDKSKENEKLTRELKRNQDACYNLESEQREKIRITKENEDLRKTLEKKEKTLENVSKKLSSLEITAKEKDEENQHIVESLNATIKKLETDCHNFRDQCDQLEYSAQDAERARNAEVQLRNKLVKKECELDEMQKTLIEEQERFRNSASSHKSENDQLIELNLIQKQKMEECLTDNKLLIARLAICEQTLETFERDKKEAQKLNSTVEQLQISVEDKSKEIEKLIKDLKHNQDDACFKLEAEQREKIGLAKQNEDLCETVKKKEKLLENLSEKLFSFEIVAKEKEQETELLLENLNAKIIKLETDCHHFQDQCERLECSAQDAERARNAEVQLRNKLVKKECELNEIQKTLSEEQEQFRKSALSNKSENDQLMELNLIQKQKLEECLTDNKLLIERLAVCEQILETSEFDKKEAQKLNSTVEQLQISVEDKSKEIEKLIKDLKRNQDDACFKLEAEQREKIGLAKQNEDLCETVKKKEKLLENLSEKLFSFEIVAKEKEQETELLLENLNAKIIKLETDCHHFQDQCERLECSAQDAEYARNAEVQLRVKKEYELDEMQKTLSEVQEQLRNSVSSHKSDIDQLMERNLIQTQKMEECLTDNKLLIERLAVCEQTLETFEFDKKEAQKLNSTVEQLQISVEDKSKEIEKLIKDLKRNQDDACFKLEAEQREKIGLAKQNEDLCETVKKKEKMLENLSEKLFSFEIVAKQNEDLCETVKKKEKMLEIVSEKLFSFEIVAKEKEQETELLLENLNAKIIKLETDCHHFRDQCERLECSAQDAEYARNAEVQLRVKKEYELDEMQKTLSEVQEQLRNSASSHKSDVDQLMERNLIQTQKMEECLANNKLLLERLTVCEQTLERSERDKKVLKEETFVQKQRLQNAGRMSRLSSETFQSIHSGDAVFGTRPGLNCEDEGEVMLQGTVTPVPMTSTNDAGTELVVPSHDPVESIVFKRPLTPTPIARLKFDSSNEENDCFDFSTKENPSLSVSSSACSTPTDWQKRLSILNDRNQHVPQHLRSFYPVETQRLPMEVREDDLKNTEHYQPPASVQHLRSRENFQTVTSSKSKGITAVRKSPFENFRKKIIGKPKPDIVVDKADLPENAKMKKSALAYNIENSPIAKRQSKKSSKRKPVEQFRDFIRTPNRTNNA